jgi:hypothetical protein
MRKKINKNNKGCKVLSLWSYVIYVWVQAVSLVALHDLATILIENDGKV